MQKRGQVTLFVVLGIVIVSVIFLGIYFKSSIMELGEKSILSERKGLTAEEMDIAGSIDDCLRLTLEDALIVVSRDGGYYPPKKGSIEYVDNNSLSFNIPLYFDEGKEDVPELEDMALSFANYIERFLPVCMEQIEGQFEIVEQPKVKVVLQDTIRAEVIMKVKLSQSRLKSFFTELEISSKETFGLVKPFYDSVSKFNHSIEAANLAGYSFDHGLNYTYEIVDKDVFYFLIWENYIRKRPLIFSFGERKAVEFEPPFEIDEEEEYGGDDASENDTEEPPEEDIPFEELLEAFSGEPDEE